MGQEILSIGFGERVVSNDSMDVFDDFLSKNWRAKEVDELNVSNDGLPGELFFFVVAEEPGAVRLSEVERYHAKAIARAKRNWEKFRKFAAKRGVVVGEGELWLVPNEVVEPFVDFQVGHV
jgi:hypothetical protein